MVGCRVGRIGEARRRAGVSRSASEAATCEPTSSLSFPDIGSHAGTVSAGCAREREGRCSARSSSATCLSPISRHRSQTGAGGDPPPRPARPASASKQTTRRHGHEARHSCVADAITRRAPCERDKSNSASRRAPDVRPSSWRSRASNARVRAARWGRVVEELPRARTRRSRPGEKPGSESSRRIGSNRVPRPSRRDSRA